jgi:hypothetical protein
MTRRIVPAELGKPIHVWAQKAKHGMRVRAAGEAPPSETKAYAHYIIKPDVVKPVAGAVFGLQDTDIMYAPLVSSLIAVTTRAQIAWTRRQPVIKVLSDSELVEHELSPSTSNNTWFPHTTGVKTPLKGELRQISNDVSRGWFLPGANPHVAGTLYIAPISLNDNIGFVDAWEIKKVGVGDRIDIWNWSDVAATDAHIDYIREHNDSHTVMEALSGSQTVAKHLAYDAAIRQARSAFKNKDVVKSYQIQRAITSCQQQTTDRKLRLFPVEHKLQGFHNQYKSFFVAAKLIVSPHDHFPPRSQWSTLSTPPGAEEITTAIKNNLTKTQTGTLVTVEYVLARTNQLTTEHWITKNTEAFTKLYETAFGPDEPIRDLTVNSL